MSSGWSKWIVFTSLLLAAPWPWYLFAVGGLLPVPVILLMAFSLLPSALLAGVLAVCAALGVAAFYFLARWLGRRSPAVRTLAAALAAVLMALASFLPIYGGGENLATPAGKFANAYVAYQNELKLVSSRFADRTSKR